MTIESTTETLIDYERNREIPVRIYHPNEPNGKTVIFSHGLGGSMDSYKYYGEYLAAHGFRSIHPTHYGIDARLLKDKRPFQVLKEAGSHPENFIYPPLDVRFVADHFGLSEYIMGGHSFGSYTTLVLSGQDITKLNTATDLKDKRIICSIAMSPHAVITNPEHAYDEVDVPMLHITGKHDDSPFGFFEPIQRRIPFDNIHCGNQYLMIFDDADHMVFAAQRRGNKFSAKDISVMKLTCAVSLEFLKKYALESESELDFAGFSANLQKHGIFEKKS